MTPIDGSTMSDQYIERRRTCTARQVTPDTSAEVAEWIGGMAMPDGSVLYKVGDVWLTAPVSHYLVRQGERISHIDEATFNATWAPTEPAS